MNVFRDIRRNEESGIRAINIWRRLIYSGLTDIDSDGLLVMAPLQISTIYVFIIAFLLSLRLISPGSVCPPSATVAATGRKALTGVPILVESSGVAIVSFRHLVEMGDLRDKHHFELLIVVLQLTGS